MFGIDTVPCTIYGCCFYSQITCPASDESIDSIVVNPFPYNLGSSNDRQSTDIRSSLNAVTIIPSDYSRSCNFNIGFAKSTYSTRASSNYCRVNSCPMGRILHFNTVSSPADNPSSCFDSCISIVGASEYNTIILAYDCR